MDPLPPVHPNDPYYLTEPAEQTEMDCLSAEEDWFWGCDDDECDDCERWDQEVGVQWETR